MIHDSILNHGSSLLQLISREIGKESLSDLIEYTVENPIVLIFIIY